MLGTRRVNGIALDLWCGRYQEFVADQVVMVESESDLSDFLASQQNEQNSKFHVVLVTDRLRGIEPASLMRRIIDSLVSGQCKSLRRVTVISEKLAGYKAFQVALFEQLPDFEKE